MDGILCLAVASITDTRSQIFKWNAGQFRLDHTFDTQQVTDIVYLPFASYLVVTSETAGLSILTPSGVNGRFTTNITLPLLQPVRVEKVGMGFVIFVTNRQSPGQMFVFEENEIQPTEITSVVLPVAGHIYPLVVSSGTTLLGATGVILNSQEQSILYEIIRYDPNLSDYNSKNLTLTFGPGESRLTFAISIFDDGFPELGEDFSVAINNVAGGARLGQQISSTITILTNDNAHGLIGFTNSSRSIIISEMSSNFVISLEVERRSGTFGVVRVEWIVSGDHSAGEITPISGQVIFEDGISLANIMLTVLSDDISELDEVTTITLTNIIENGVLSPSDQSRGAMLIPGQTEAVVRVQANDDPHGVVAWSPTLLLVQELEGTDAVYQLNIVREFGFFGDIIISYTVGVDLSRPTNERAQLLMDFIPLSGEIVIGDGQVSATVGLTILQDNIPESNESLIVNITNVRIANETDGLGSVSNSPRVSESRRILEVTIEENDDNRGLFSFDRDTVSVEEVSDSQVIIQVTRMQGTLGSVSVEYNINEGSATNFDYEPPLNGLLVFESEQVSTLITINIINDQIPEEDEIFTVVLTSGMGGGEIGTPSSINVTILSNDDINGVFFFTDNSLLIVIPESSDEDGSVGVASLTVERGVSSVGETTIFWEVSDEGRQDLEPISGNLTFVENSMEQTFSVRAVQDGIPEPFEAFVISLVSSIGGGRIVDPRESFVAIQASDDPAGVLGLQQFPEGLLVNEGDVIVVGVVRGGGSSGTVTLTWDITPSDSTVFVTVTDTVVLLDGQSEASISIQTLSDDIPEVRRSFSLQILSTSLARIDLDATTVEIIVAASNNPHGSVQFTSSSPITTTEGVGSIELNIIRLDGLNGYLLINFTTILDSASSVDFNIDELFIIIASEQTTATIVIDITDDIIPELDESFSLRLTSVELLNTTNDELSQLPSLGSTTEVIVVIEASDSPFGSIALTRSIYNVLEGDTVTIILQRFGGALGVSTVTYSTVNGRAIAGEDYIANTGTAVFAQGQTTAQISVSTLDDSTPEVVEDFSFALLEVNTGSLGNITMTTIFIEASDSPFGIVGFEPEVVTSGISISNPTTSPTVVSLTVIRMGGMLGSTDISWNVTGPGNSGIPSSDISSSTVAGVLTLIDGQSSGRIQIILLPTSIDEVQETFTVSLISTTNEVVINSNFYQVIITVGQNGSPFAIISFLGDAIRNVEVTEMDVPVTLSLPLERDGDISITSDVRYTVTRVGGGESPVELDVTPVTATVIFPILQGLTSIDLTILPDGIGEVDEIFQVTLSEPRGATLNPQASIATFTISANGNPFGEFGVVNGSISFSNIEGSRILSYTIIRRREGEGLIADANVTILHTYNQNPTEEVLISRTLVASSLELLVTFPITFLYPGSTITASITSVLVISPPEVAGSNGGISTTDGSLQISVTDDIANIVIGFTPQSLSARVDESATVDNVVLTVFRQGELGAAEVSWTTDVPATTGFTPGSLLPQSGNIQFPLQQNTTTLTLTAVPSIPHGRAEIFQVQLQVLSLNSSFPSRVDAVLGRSLVEPMGVFQIANTPYSALEGTMASIQVWRRFGSMESVVVSGIASVISPSELPSSDVLPATLADFISTPLSLTMEEGVTTGLINITLTDNNISSELIVFRFSLTSVTSTSSLLSSTPRLSASNTVTTVTIVDDEGGAGLFQLSPTSSTITEGSTLVFNVIRSGGNVGRITLILRTLDTGLATNGDDFTAVDEEVIFENGVSLVPMSISIIDDDIPEAAEDFTVILISPEYSVGILDPNADSLSVIIEASDSAAGVFSFITASLTLSDDGPTSGELEVRRTVGLVGIVTLTWEALYTDGRDHPVALTNILVSTRGTITFDDNSAVPTSNIVIQLQTDRVPATGEVFTVRLSSDSPGVGFTIPTDSIVTLLPRIIGVFSIIENNLTSVVTSTGDINLHVERTAGLQIVSTLMYSTFSPSQPISIGRLTFQPAIPFVHFPQIETSTTFTSGQALQSIDIPVLSIGTSPVAFSVQIQSSSHQVTNSTAIVVISAPGSLSSLYSIYFESLTISSPQQLEKVALDLMTILNSGLVSGTDIDQSDVTHFIIDELIQKTLTPNNIDYSNTQYVSTVLDIFQSLLQPNTSFAGRSQFVQSMKSFAYSLLEDVTCNEPEIKFFRSQFYLEASKLSPFNLTDRRFASNNDNADYVQLPSQLITTQLDCVNVHYIEFFNDQLLMSPTLYSKILSFGVEGVTLSRTSDPIVYRIHANHNLGLLSDRDDCLFWDEPSQTWDRSTCSPQRHFVLLENYIQCSCNQLGDMAGASDVDVGYGWTLPAPLSAIVVMIALLLAFVIHSVYFLRTQLATRILMNLFISVFMFQLIFLIDIFASDTEGLPLNGCAALGGLLQFTAIAQFVWIAVMAIALWANFLGYLKGNEPLVIYIISCWGLAIIVVVVTILIGRFAVNLELNSSNGLYGPVRDICFIPLLSASLLSTVLPIILSVLTMFAVISHTGIYWNKWEDSESIYYDSFNRREIPLLLTLFALIFLSSLGAFLHTYIGLVYTFGVFVGLNTILGLYVLVVYFFVSWNTLARQRSKYDIGNELEDPNNEEDYYGSPSLASIGGGSKQNLLEKDEYSISSPGTGVVSLDMHQLHNTNEYSPKKSSPLSDNSKDDAQMDDLLFMLRTQNFDGSIAASDDSESSIVARQNRVARGDEHFERRRISIADTHL